MTLNIAVADLARMLLLITAYTAIATIAAGIHARLGRPTTNLMAVLKHAARLTITFAAIAHGANPFELIPTG